MENSLKSWVCYDCKYLGLIGNLPDCNSQERYKVMPIASLLPEARSSVAAPTNAIVCSFKIQGNNGVFDRGSKA